MTYEELLAKYGLVEEPMCGVNEDGENVSVEICPEYACVITFQKNGWARKNIYYPDGASEEMYER